MRYGMNLKTEGALDLLSILAFAAGAPPAGTVDTPQLQRRKLLASVAIGAGMMPLMRTTASLASHPDPRLIRPPGALGESDVLARCIRCGECMKVCLTNTLQPCLWEGGLDGLWSPRIVPSIRAITPSIRSST